MDKQQMNAFKKVTMVLFRKKMLVGGSGIVAMAILAISGLAPILAGTIAISNITQWLLDMGADALAGWLGSWSEGAARRLWCKDGSLNEKELEELVNEIAERLQNNPNESAAMVTLLEKQNSVEQFFADMGDEMGAQSDVLLEILAMTKQIRDEEENIKRIMGRLHKIMMDALNTQVSERLLTAYQEGTTQLSQEIQDGYTRLLQEIQELRSLGLDPQRELKSSVYRVDIADMPCLETEPLPLPSHLPKGSRIPFHQNKHFIGRGNDLRLLASLLKHEKSIAAITGMGGIGKTQLATEFAYRYGQYYAGGVYWLSCANEENVANEVVECGGANHMNLPRFAALSHDEQVGLVKKEWQDAIPRLLIFDDCEDETLFRNWCPKTGGCRVLVTSRRAIWSSAMGVQTYRLGVLSRTESIALLRQFRPDLDETDADLNELADELGDLPLALHLAGKFLETYKVDVSVRDYLNELHEESLLEHESLQGLDLNASPTNHELHVGKTFVQSYQKLQDSQKEDALARALLARMSWFAPGEPVPRDLLLHAITLPSRGSRSIRLATQALNRLANLGLLDIDGDDENNSVTLYLHRLLATFVQQALPDTQAQQDVQQAILQSVANASKSGEAAKLISLYAHVQYVINAKLEDDNTDMLQRIECHLAIAETATLQRNIQTAEQHYGEVESLLKHIEPQLTPIDLSHYVARLCYGMGTLLEYTDPDAAIKWLDKGLTKIDGNGTFDEAILSFRKGAVCNGKESKESFEEALTLLSRAKVIFATDDSSWRIRTLSNLGIAACSIGNIEDGTAYYEEALELCERTNNRYEKIPIYNNQAYDLDIAGDWKNSVQKYKDALELAEEFQDNEFLATIPLNLGILYTNMGDEEAAHRYLDKSIHNARLYAIDEALILALIAKSDLYSRLDKWLGTAYCIYEAEEMSPEIITPRQQAEINRMWALIHLERGNQERALEYAQKAVDVSDEGADIAMEKGMSYRVLAQVTSVCANPTEAIAHFQTSLSYVEDDVPYEAARTYLEWGKFEQSRGNNSDAAIHLEHARSIFTNLGAKRDVALVKEIEHGKVML